MNEQRTHAWDKCFEDKKERLRQPESWFPYPVLLSVLLILHFTSQVLFNTSSRMGSPAEVIELDSKPTATTTLWFSVTPINDEIVVISDDHKIFRWKQDVRNKDDLKEFRDFLKTKTKAVVLSATMAKEKLKSKTRAIIAADQRLKYLHIRPIIYALAEAGISQYGFETKIPALASETETERHQTPSSESIN